MSNFTCHINRDEKDGQHLTHLTTENQQAYLKHTIHYLSEMGYEPTEADKAFIEKYADEENRALFLEAFRF